MWKKSRSSEKDEQRRNKTSFVTSLSSEDFFDLLDSGKYQKLVDNAEVISCVNTIAGQIASMSIHLMEQNDEGNKRIENELSRFIDIKPNAYMGRYNFIFALIKRLMLDDGNAVASIETQRGQLYSLNFLDNYSFQARGFGYVVNYNGRQYLPNELLHFRLNPSIDEPWRGEGYKVSLNSVVESLNEAGKTKKAFLNSKYMPFIIIKGNTYVDGMDEEENRRKFIDKRIADSEKGRPWLIGDDMDVVTVKPLSMQDLAIEANIKLDKQTVAGIFGVPPFVVGIGEFKQSEWNNFIDRIIKPIATMIAQELTDKLLTENNKQFFRFNIRSLYSYDIATLSSVGEKMRNMGVIDGNEYRALVGFSPRPELNELVALENYIPLSKLGDQKKLETGEEETILS